MRIKTNYQLTEHVTIQANVIKRKLDLNAEIINK